MAGEILDAATGLGRQNRFPLGSPDQLFAAPEPRSTALQLDSTGSASAGRFSQMILIAWDGAQMAHTLELMKRGALPNLKRLVRDGGFAPTWVMGHCTGTLSGFGEILTGYGPEITGAYGLLRSQPIPRELTVFYRLKQRFNGDVATVFIAGKALRLHSTPGGPWQEARADIDVWYGDKARKHPEVGGLATDWLVANARPGMPFFCFVHFKEPDPQGHRYGENSPEYEAAFMELDAWLGSIRSTLSACGLASTTAVCVVTDHGFDEGSTRHAHAPDAWLATNWTPLLEGYQYDVGPTILAAFGVDLDSLSPPLPGRPLWQPAAPSRLLLQWVGDGNFVGGAVSPVVGMPGRTRFAFKVRVQDYDGDEPDFVRLRLQQDRQLWCVDGLKPVDASPIRLGRTYAMTLKEPLPLGRYAYRFRAADDDGLAMGKPTSVVAGPRLVPKLAFTKSAGLSDGVEPNSGIAGDTIFRFRVRYREGEGDPANFVRVRLWRDGAFYRALQMIPGDLVPDATTGAVYRCRRPLPAGSYEYAFEAQDNDGAAVGSPTQRTGGLVVSEGPALALTSLCALPTRAGAQISFSLSSPAQVQARVLNVAGRQIRALCRAQDCVRGATGLIWDALSDTGLPVPSGTYLVEVTAKAPDGAETRALTQVRLHK